MIGPFPAFVDERRAGSTPEAIDLHADFAESAVRRSVLAHFSTDERWRGIISHRHG